MTLLAVFNALLSRLTGQGYIVVGSPIAGRSRGEFEGPIGLFMNTLVLRTDSSTTAALANFYGGSVKSRSKPMTIRRCRLNC